MSLTVESAINGYVIRDNDTGQILTIADNDRVQAAIDMLRDVNELIGRDRRPPRRGAGPCPRPARRQVAAAQARGLSTPLGRAAGVQRQQQVAVLLRSRLRSSITWWLLGGRGRRRLGWSMSHRQDVFRVGDAQVVLGVKSPTTIKNWIALGRFPGARQTEGDQWLLPVEEVYALRDASAAAALANRRLVPTAFVGRRGRRDPFAELDKT